MKKLMVLHMLLTGMLLAAGPQVSAQDTYVVTSAPIAVKIIPAGEVEKKYRYEIEADCKASPLFAPKGEFETQDMYKKRQVDADKFREGVVAKYKLLYEQFLKDQQQQRELAAEEKIRKIRNSLYEEPFTFESFGTYNPEEQYFPVRIRGANYKLAIPLSEAPTFKQNLNQVSLKLDRQLKEDGVTWDFFNFRITHPVTGSTYLLNEKKPLYQEARNFTVARGNGGVPKLSAKVTLTEPSGNKLLDAGETATIEITVTNEGTGAASLFRVEASASTAGVTVEKEKALGDILPGNSRALLLQASAAKTVVNGSCNISLKFSEANGFQPADYNLEFNTQAFRAPKLEFVEARIKDNGNGNNVIENGEVIDVTVLLQNTGQGRAQNVKSVIRIEDSNIICTTPDKLQLNHAAMESGESKSFTFSFVVNNNYKGADVLPIRVILSESEGTYGGNASIGLEMKKVSLVAQNIRVQGDFDQDKEIKSASLSSDVDVNIPETGQKNKNRFALIIGNENYTKYQSGLNPESNVAFAAADAQVFSLYAEKTLGIPKENIFLHTDLISSRMKNEVEKLSKLAEYSRGEAELVFFYAGHGFPDEQTREAYLVPVDIGGANVRDGLKLADLYARLTQYPAKKVTVFLDACFSGGGRDASLLVASRGVKVKAKEETLKGNLVVFTASSGEQVSLPYRDKMHGMFTYYLLRKLQETKGQLSYQELGDYIRYEVQLNSIKVNGKDQNPQVLFNPDIKGSWENWRLN